MGEDKGHRGGCLYGDLLFRLSHLPCYPSRRMPSYCHYNHISQRSKFEHQIYECNKAVLDRMGNNLEVQASRSAQPHMYSCYQSTGFHAFPFATMFLSLSYLSYHCMSSVTAFL